MYCGIDLHARNNYIALLTQKRKLVTQGRYDNDLGVVIAALEPYREEIDGIAIESTFNWYWLVDGLMDHGYKHHLANTNEAQQYDGLKYADDRHDARWLALLLLLGILPEGYIYPKEERPNRDLCRRRAFLVRKRTSMLTSMRGAYGCRTGEQVGRNEIARWTEEDLEVLLPDPKIRLGLSCLLEPMWAINDQIRILEKAVLTTAKLRDSSATFTKFTNLGADIGEVGERGSFLLLWVGLVTRQCSPVTARPLRVGYPVCSRQPGQF
jgi:transposase